jgi:hypothetical protein
MILALPYVIVVGMLVVWYRLGTDKSWLDCARMNPV